jgi:hypothetical protein
MKPGELDQKQNWQGFFYTLDNRHSGRGLSPAVYQRLGKLPKGKL